MSERRVALPLDEQVGPVPRQRPLRLRVHAVLRWLHVYISMASLLVILFFAVTGVTLNHPEWVFGKAEAIAEVDGALPAGWNDGGEIDWLAVVEHMRAEHGVRGSLIDYRADEFEGSLAFKAPGYSADAFFDPASGEYQLTMVTQGPVAVLNELHRAQDARGPWRVIVDASGVLLALLSITGIGLLLYLRKFRVSGLATLVIGCVAAVIIMRLAL